MSMSPLMFNSLLPCPSLFNEVESLADTGIIDYEEATATVQVSVRGSCFLHSCCNEQFVCLFVRAFILFILIIAPLHGFLFAAGWDGVHQDGTK